jgi:hypothetical protein
MTDRKSKKTSLWKLIEGMQRRLEAAGLDHDVVDVAVTRGLEAWFDTVPSLASAHRRHGRFPSWCTPPAIAKA